MPNWCGNHVEIEGPEDVIVKLVAELARPYEAQTLSYDASTGGMVTQTAKIEGPLLLWNIVHPEVDEMDDYWGKDGKDGQWYRWNVAAWGTKWDLGGETQVDRSPGKVAYSFETAWSPVLPAFDRLAASHPELSVRVEYDEPGMDFAGIAVWESGSLVSHDETTSRDRYCEICDENYRLEWDEQDTSCPNADALEEGTWEHRAHLARHHETPADVLDQIARSESSNADEYHDDEEIMHSLAWHPNLSRDTRIWMALNLSERTRRLLISAFTREDVEAFSQSDNPDLRKLASLIVVDHTAG